jgi:metallophosphoesterase (TIGR00282 family)
MSNVPTTIRILVVGDAVGRPGRSALTEILPRFRRDGRAHFIIANGENSAAGKGITQETAREMHDAGVDVITTGNHVWDNKDVFKFIGEAPRLLRPLNFGNGMSPGRGYGVFTSGGAGVRIGVLNIIGRVHMAHHQCPFAAATAAIAELRKETPIVIVDLHAEATSEKVAMGWHLDGQASLVFGTHTHVPTADHRILPGGTAYVTDIGMTGGQDGIIGVTREPVLHKFLTGLPVRHEVAEGNVWLSGALVEIDVATGRALTIERVWEKP